MKYFLIIALLLNSFATNAQLLTEPDKQKHFMAGAFFGTFAYGLVLDETEDKTQAFVASIVTAFAVGAIKESLDSRQDGNRFDKRDLLATTYGGITIGITLDIFAKNGKKKGRVFKLK